MTFLIEWCKIVAFFLTGGRPMTNEGYAMYDVVAKKNVFYFRDSFGRRYMAFYRWSLWRIPTDDINHCEEVQKEIRRLVDALERKSTLGVHTDFKR